MLSCPLRASVTRHRHYYYYLSHNQSFSLIAPAVCVKITLASKKQHRLTRRCPEIPGTVRSAAAPELPSEGQKHRGRVPESCNYARLGETPIRHNVRNVYLMFSVLGIIYTGDTRHSPDSHNKNNNEHHEHCMQGRGQVGDNTVNCNAQWSNALQ